jgi:hypothetical protein
VHCTYLRYRDVIDVKESFQAVWENRIAIGRKVRNELKRRMSGKGKKEGVVSVEEQSSSSRWCELITIRHKID